MTNNKASFLNVWALLFFEYFGTQPAAAFSDDVK
jgi:hypothetical protein